MYKVCDCIASGVAMTKVTNVHEAVISSDDDSNNKFICHKRHAVKLQDTLHVCS